MNRRQRFDVPLKRRRIDWNYFIENKEWSLVRALFVTIVATDDPFGLWRQVCGKRVRFSSARVVESDDYKRVMRAIKNYKIKAKRRRGKWYVERLSYIAWLKRSANFSFPAKIINSISRRPKAEQLRKALAKHGRAILRQFPNLHPYHLAMLVQPHHPYLAARKRTTPSLRTVKAVLVRECYGGRTFGKPNHAQEQAFAAAQKKYPLPPTSA